MIIEFTIPGPPQGKARPKVVRMKNGFSHTYTPDKTVAYEELVRSRFIMAAEQTEWTISDKPLQAQIVALYPVPKSTSKKNRAAMLAGMIHPTKKPDCDNIEKIVYDALNGFAYKDDAQIVKQSIVKRYYEGAGEVRVRIVELGGN